MATPAASPSAAACKLINTPADFVPEVIEGLCEAHAGLARLDRHPVVLRRTPNCANVALLSGGGSGHEPAHAGFVGRGMLSAAVCGAVFASPSVAAVLAGIRACATPAGVLLIVKNYTGDRLNFGLAAERAKAEGIACEVVVVADDAALPPSAGIAGRRGLAGTVLVHKIAGAAAEAGLPLADVAAEARRAAAALATVGVALSVGALPGCAPARQLPHGCCELGLGIHGEPGAQTVRLPSADVLVAQMLDRILSSGYVSFAADVPVVLLVNNLGATPVAELAVVCRAAMAHLRVKGVRVARLFSGTLMTSLDAAGMSLTLLHVDDAAMLARLDAATDAPAWPSHAGRPGDAAPATVPAADDSVAQAHAPHAAATAAGAALRASIRAGARAVAEMEAQLSSWDAAVGDGDCGTTLAAGAAAVLEDEACYDVDDPAAAAAGLAASVRRAMGGTSGVLYDILFSAAEASLRSSTGDSWTPRLAAALEQAARAVAHHGGADKGMRTMLDALLPAAEAASAAVSAGGDAAAVLDAAVAAAEHGADATMRMPALAGRSSYVPAAVLASTPDPGAKAAAAWLRAAATAAVRA